MPQAGVNLIADRDAADDIGQTDKPAGRVNRSSSPGCRLGDLLQTGADDGPPTTVR